MGGAKKHAIFFFLFLSQINSSCTKQAPKTYLVKFISVLLHRVESDVGGFGAFARL